MTDIHIQDMNRENSSGPTMYAIAALLNLLPFFRCTFAITFYFDNYTFSLPAILDEYSQFYDCVFVFAARVRVCM